MKAKLTTPAKDGTEVSDEGKSSKEDSEAISTSSTRVADKAALSDKDARLVGKSQNLPRWSQFATRYSWSFKNLNVVHPKR